MEKIPLENMNEDLRRKVAENLADGISVFRQAAETILEQNEISKTPQLIHTLMKTLAVYTYNHNLAEGEERDRIQAEWDNELESIISGSRTNS